MTALFSKPNVPTPPVPEKTPTIDSVAQNTDMAERLRRRKGAASTILVPNATGSLGTGGAVPSSVLGG